MGKADNHISLAMFLSMLAGCEIHLSFEAVLDTKAGMLLSTRLDSSICIWVPYDIDTHCYAVPPAAQQQLPLV